MRSSPPSGGEHLGLYRTAVLGMCGSSVLAAYDTRASLQMSKSMSPLTGLDRE
jgi:hypothetical protein